MVELMHDCGLPPKVVNLVNLVNGRGSMTGEAVVSEPGIDRVAFTGGTEDADLERALDGALLGILSNNGQQCLAGSQILVQRRIALDFIGRFAERTRWIRVGDPMNPDTEVGPLCFQSHLERVLGYVDLARQEVIALASDARFGLVCYLSSASLDAAMQVSRSVRAGTIWINTPMIREWRAPFGGYKDSGIGRDGPQSSAEFFTEPKTTTVPLDPPPLRPLGRH
jgi:5-carboxymethyl-2-hydroxymuconic-semialdehyde dehydrogenase